MCFPRGSRLDAPLKKTNLMKAIVIKHRNQNDANPFQTRNIDVENIRKKSAEASNKPPSLLSACSLLASAPSKASVRQAKAKTGKPRPPSMRVVIKTHVSTTRADVKYNGVENNNSSFILKGKPRETPSTIFRGSPKFIPQSRFYTDYPSVDDTKAAQSASTSPVKINLMGGVTLPLSEDTCAHTDLKSTSMN